jgi:glycosyltransferase involved in cell wall biosynthesis
MKITFDSQIFTLQEYGGISRYICSLANHLADIEGVDANIVAPFYINAYLDKLPKQLVFGIKIPRIPKAGIIVHLCSLFFARFIIGRQAPQIIHETYFSPKLLAPKGIPTILTVYDMIDELFTSKVVNKQLDWKRIATQKADHIICISECTRKDLIKLYDLPEHKVSVVYLGFDALIPSVAKIEKIKPYLFYVGHRGDYKNFEGFLRAYAKSSWLSKQFDVVCFGGGVFSSVEKKLFKELNLSDEQLHQMTGNDQYLASYYRDAALFVYPSLYEGFGIPPLEAMSLGCPVACSNTSSIPEVVGDAAEYFDPNDTESICVAMELVLTSTERQADLINRGYERCTQFTWERCAQETLAVYRSIL